jgi:hypothetical protein
MSDVSRLALLLAPFVVACTAAPEKDGEHTGATPRRVVRGPGWEGT